LRDVRSEARRHPVSGDIILVAIDNQSLNKIGNYPWPRHRQAELADKLASMGAKRILFDIIFAAKTDPENDMKLAHSLQRLGDRVVLALQFDSDPVTSRVTESYPFPELAEHAKLAHINFQYTDAGKVYRLPFGLKFEKGTYPSFASELGRVHSSAEDFPVDYALDPSTVPTVSAVDLLNGKVPLELIKGKDVVIGATYGGRGDGYVTPGYGIMPSVYLHIIGAETLKEGPPVEWPWLIVFIPALAIVAASGFVKRRLFSVAALGAGIAGALILPFFLERHMIFPEVVPSLFLMTTVGACFSWSALRQMYRARGITNAVSGLPNLNALHQQKVNHERALVAARVHNYAAIAAALPAGGEKAFIDQIAKRLMVGASDALLYQGDEGIFMWFADAGPTPTGEHLDALHTLFRSPVIVQDKQYDLTITFGFEAEPGRSIANRLASALLAADQALSQGLKWKEHDHSIHEDTAWKLSLLSQLDAAVDGGDLWVAYQPKLDLTTGKVGSAEALARWTHPEKGAISPLEFILAAEQNNRIEKLTYFVLEHAVRVAAAINAQGMEFGVSVNLSARLIEDQGLVAKVTETLAKHGLKPEHLTLEVTETAALSSSLPNMCTLQELRDLGVQISVDDYGTGLSTLDYLQRIPATEIKIDRSFVMAMRENHGARVMVNSTIQLAHSLGQKVVAEGVEDQETLDDLTNMHCDLAQGYHIGRPVAFKALSKQLLGQRSRAA
jgi:EAL domain-containing protein (putative c-di-GMP-specific phosphodiesterase class I)/CHASE2 domain-containing sensor protein